jgi:hypothetical protein
MPRVHLDALLNSDTGQQGKALSQELIGQARRDSRKWTAVSCFARFLAGPDFYLAWNKSYVLSYGCQPPLVLSFFRHATAIVQG